MITVNGIYTIPHDVYHQDPCPTPSLSSSVAKVLLRQSPAHAAMQHPKLNNNYVNAESSRFDLGTIAHALLLEDDSSRLITIEADDWRTKAAKEARDAARAEGKIPILTKQAAHLLKMVGTARDFLRSSEVGDMTFLPEQTLAWQEGTSLHSADRANGIRDTVRVLLARVGSRHRQATAVCFPGSRNRASLCVQPHRTEQCLP